jgi:hypothetical protein
MLETLKIARHVPVEEREPDEKRRSMAWLERAHAAGKAALATGNALWFKRGLQQGKTAPIRVDSSLRRSMGLSHDQARRGIHALAAAGAPR